MSNSNTNGKYRWAAQFYDVDRNGQGSQIDMFTNTETPLDLQVGGQMSGMGDGYYESQAPLVGPTRSPADEDPWYETRPVWRGDYKENSGEDNEGPQAPLPKAPSHQAILQKFPGWQPMEYALTREYSKQYVDVLNPQPVIGEEQDWGGTMLSAEQRDYARAHREMMNMPGEPEETQDPYGNYDQITGAQIHTPAPGMYGMGDFTSPFDRRRMIAKIAARYIAQAVPVLKRKIVTRAHMAGLGAASATATGPLPTAAVTPKAPPKPGEAGYTFDLGAELAKAINTIAPAAISYATGVVDKAIATPGGVPQLQMQLQQPPRLSEEFPWGTVALIGGGVLAALFVLPKVLGR